MDEEREYPFELSVIMAVYNVEPFLREAVDSLIAQDFGFERIQLIMVDDGSADGSGAICDEYAEQYPENVMVIHKENGGVSSARNAALEYAAGRYLNFMDSDDKLSKNTCSAVVHFFEKHMDETDVAAIPLVYFDGQRGQHLLNAKFKKGPRVIDLYQEYSFVQLSMSSTFVKHEALRGKRFNEQLTYAEDAEMLLRILMGKGTLGVVPKATYHYRKRSAGEASALQRSISAVSWYLPPIQFFHMETIRYCLDKCGYIPKFVQYTLAYDLQWRYKQKMIPQGILTPEEEEKYRQGLQDVLQYIDDDIIMAQKYIAVEHKYYMLSKKYDCAPVLTARQNNMMIHYGNTLLTSMSRHSSQIDFLRIKDGTLFMEGFTSLFGIEQGEPVEIFLLVNGEKVPCKQVCRDSLNKYALGDLILRRIGFRAEICLAPEVEQYTLRLLVRCRGVDILKTGPKLGKFVPLTTAYRNSYFYRQGYVLTVSGPNICVKKCGRKGHLQREWAFLKELWKKNKLGGRKAVLARLAYHALKWFKRKPMWLISDRIMKADDNGEAFFCYMRRQHSKEINTYFVIDKDSVDYDRLKKLGPVVRHLSWKHKLLLLLCDYNISSQADEITRNPFPGYSDGFKDILSQERFVFLQHGVIKDDLSGWLNRYSKNLAMFVTTTIPEYQSILDYQYNYTSNVVKMTGLPRHDQLYHQEKKIITIMPTWRAYLVTGADTKTGKRELKPGYCKSRYFAMYNDLLNNRRLFDAAQHLGYTIAFLPHPNMICAQDSTNGDQRLKVLGQETSYRSIFAESDLLITDYSSVAFDFVYLRKPVIYYQVDQDEFFSGTHTYEKGYFDYERDGFGEVEYDLESTVDRMIEYMKNGCRLKEKYRARIDAAFPFSDQNNCQRVYETILELKE